MYRAIICASGATRRADGACRAWEAPNDGLAKGGSGEDGSETVVEPARAGASACAEPVEVHAGDELVLAGSTRFMLIEGMPESWE